MLSESNTERKQFTGQKTLLTQALENSGGGGGSISLPVNNNSKIISPITATSQVAVKMAITDKTEVKDMSFFSNIFKKKSGGTVVGNLIRGVASTATGGILGQGTELAKWEAEQAQIAYDKTVQDAVTAKLMENANYQAGVGLSNDSGMTDTANAYKTSAVNSDTGQAVKSTVIKDWFVSNWYWLLIALGVISGGAYLLTRGKRGKLV